jgi:hypothetical protein
MFPSHYNYLKKETAPKMILEGLRLVGTTEAPGHSNNPVIIGWAKELGEDVAKVYLADEIPWCGLAMAIVAKRAGKPVPKDPLWALNWGNFGIHSPIPMLGDVLVFTRKTRDGKKAGHVAMYVGESTDTYHIMGGNQADTYGFTEISKSRLYVARRPIYTTQPANVRQIILNSNGIISNNEQ